MVKLNSIDGTRFSIDKAHTLLKKVLTLGWQADLDLTYFQLLQTRYMLTISNHH